MALSNWLTRDEWNAAFLAYLAVEERPAPDLSLHLRVGICYVHLSGYTAWKGIRVGDPDDPRSVSKDYESAYKVDAITAERDNSACLLEIMEGHLDLSKRAQETLVWMDKHPELQFPHLRSLCEHLTNRK